ncbi:MAG: M56 family metallopeptidase [Saprospiraceae bacterium]|nr:M56 family metallopeptidase [Saprospiraceae bacterium]
MFTYLLQVSLFWGLFALLYNLLLRRETFFRANRFYLLGTLAAGLLMPLTYGLAPAIGLGPDAFPAYLPEFTIVLQQVGHSADNWSGIQYLAWIYGIGSAFTAMRMLWGVFRIARLIRQSPAEQLPVGGVLLRTPAAVVPFSFFHWIFVPTDFDNRPDDKNMLLHELAHVRAWHSVDVLLLEILCIVFWFHPLAHWYRRSLRTVHEYQADAAASDQTTRKQYSLLLLRQTQPQLALSFANHFFQSPLKQRLLMLNRKHSPLTRRWKFGLVLPVALVFWGISQQPFSVGPLTSSPAPDKRPANTAAQFPGGMAALATYLTQAIKYPEAAKRENAEGRVTLKIELDKTGAVANVEAVQPVPRTDMADEAVRVVRQMPNWQPALQEGKPVQSKFQLPIQFKLN